MQLDEIRNGLHSYLKIETLSDSSVIEDRLISLIVTNRRRAVITQSV
jgi:hypothetical protein